MAKRSLSVAVVAFAASLPVSGQTTPAPLVVTAYNAGAPFNYTVPRTAAEGDQER